MRKSQAFAPQPEGERVALKRCPSGRARYSDSLTQREQNEYEALLREISRTVDLAKQFAARYETMSISSAMASRNRLRLNMDSEEALILRLYGRYGININNVTRASSTAYKRIREHPPIEEARRNVRIFKNLTGKHRASDIITEPYPGTQRRLIMRYLKPPGRLHQAVPDYLDHTIINNQSRRPKDGRFYRVSHVKKGTYVPENEAKSLGLDGKDVIKTNDIISDRALWSVGDDWQAILRRYSNKDGGEGITRGKVYSRRTNEEEVLFVIEHNSALQAMDIAGYKHPQETIPLERNDFDSDAAMARAQSSRRLGETRFRVGDDKYSSGEHLIRSQSKFKVVGIQNTERNMARRMVFLRPVADTDVDDPTPIKNQYDGSLYSPGAQSRPPSPLSPGDSGMAARATPLPEDVV